MRSFNHPYHWFVEPLIDDPSYLERRMFGSLGCYIFGRLVLVLCAQQEEPWNGILIATSHEFHKSLISEFPHLSQHTVLGKWLYISEQDNKFEDTVRKVVELISTNDQRIGVTPRQKQKQKRTRRK